MACWRGTEGEITKSHLFHKFHATATRIQSKFSLSYRWCIVGPSSAAAYILHIPCSVVDVVERSRYAHTHTHSALKRTCMTRTQTLNMYHKCHAMLLYLCMLMWLCMCVYVCARSPWLHHAGVCAFAYVVAFIEHYGCCCCYQSGAYTHSHKHTPIHSQPRIDVPRAVQDRREESMLCRTQNTSAPDPYAFSPHHFPIQFVNSLARIDIAITLSMVSVWKTKQQIQNTRISWFGRSSVQLLRDMTRIWCQGEYIQLHLLLFVICVFNIVLLLLFSVYFLSCCILIYKCVRRCIRWITIFFNCFQCTQIKKETHVNDHVLRMIRELTIEKTSCIWTVLFEIEIFWKCCKQILLYISGVYSIFFRNYLKCFFFVCCQMLFACRLNTNNKHSK